MAQDTQSDLSFPKGWTTDDEGTRVRLRARLDDFMAVVATVNDIAESAEALNHHPDLHVTNYNRLEVVTYSHDVGRLTDRDVALAERVSRILSHHGAKVDVEAS